MTHSQALVTFDDAQINLLKTTVAKGTTDDQFKLFLEVAQRTGLNPFAKQIYAVVRKSQEADGSYSAKMTIQTGVDGYRLIAQRTGEYAGQRGPEWCGPDGVWIDVWLSNTPPAAARVGVLRRGFEEPVWGVATYASFVQTTSQGAPSNLWKSMPDVMLAKCAEVQALRKAFPQELSGLYTDAEMGQADREPRPAIARPRSKSAPAPETVDAETGEYRELPPPEEPDAGPADGPEPEPRWTSAELASVLKAHGLVMGDLSCVLPEPVTRANFVQVIDAWMEADTERTVIGLVQAADAALRAEAAKREQEGK